MGSKEVSFVRIFPTHGENYNEGDPGIGMERGNRCIFLFPVVFRKDYVLGSSILYRYDRQPRVKRRFFFEGRFFGIAKQRSWSFGGEGSLSRV